MTFLTAGILLGLAGSAHCAAMCGPLILGAGGWAQAGHARWSRIVVYHSGRVGVYLMLSVVAGATGHLFAVGGFGRGLSVVCGVSLLIMAAGRRMTGIKDGLVQLKLRGTTASGPAPRPARLKLRQTVSSPFQLGRVFAFANRSARTHPFTAQLLMGGINGLLPCGLVYAAAITAAGMGSVSGAVLFMAGFGAGTIPVLIAMSLSASCFSLQSRATLRRLTPAALVLTGALLIVRGVMAPGVNGPAWAHHMH